MPSSKLSSRRAHFRRPTVCRPSPEPPPSGVTCELSVDPDTIGPGQSCIVNWTGFDPSSPPLSTVSLVASTTGGVLSFPDSTTNGGTATGTWTAPAQPGTYTLKVSAVFHSGVICVSTATVTVLAP